MKNIAVLILSLLLISCITTKKDIIIDTSSHGSINMIKVIDGEVYVLNSTRSSIQKIDGDSLVTVLDIDIKGRDFLLDFAKKGNEFYVSNTYDEIFRTVNGEIIDTIKVKGPDKIAFLGDNLLITSRVNCYEERNDLSKDLSYYDYDLITKELNELSTWSMKSTNEITFGQTALNCSGNYYYIFNPSRSSILIQDRNYRYIDEFDLTKTISYGNMFVENDMILILANENDKLIIFKIVKDSTRRIEINIDISSIDLRTSAIDFNKLYLYDYAGGKIEIKRWNYEK